MAKGIIIERMAQGAGRFEYRVPAPDGREAGAAYTEDKADAIGTAKAMWGGLVDPDRIRFRTVEYWSHPNA